MILGSFALCLAFTAIAADPTISDVVARQRWPWSRLVDIDYVLTCDSTQRVDVAISAYDGDTLLTLPFGSLTGDHYCVSRGPHRIVWDPTVTSYTNSAMLTSFRVTLAPATPPLYMIVDLTKEAGADGQIEYVYEADLVTNKWGAWERNPVTNAGVVVESVVWTGVTNDSVYATDKLVLRRIPWGSFAMGDSLETTVTLSTDFYAGVFEVTETQWARIMSGTSSSVTPKGSVSYDSIRGATTDEPAIDWPSTASSVATNSFLGLIRAKTGLGGFDLPTEAQWEYLCRAGTTTVFNDGSAAAAYTGSESENNGDTNKYLSVLGWYKYNTSATQPVGGLTANAWGLYDTHGNVYEWCRDWQADALTGGTDPTGADSGKYRVKRGGARSNPANNCRSAYRSSNYPNYVNAVIGFRVVMSLP